MFDRWELVEGVLGVTVDETRLLERAKYKIEAKESFLRVIIRAFKNNEGFSKERLIKRIVKINILSKFLVPFRFAEIGLSSNFQFIIL